MTKKLNLEQIYCKYDHTWYETLGEKWMGSCPMWECEWFEKAPENVELAITIAALIETKGFKCNPQCPGYTPVEIYICKKHDEEYTDICSSCEEGFEMLQEAAEIKYARGQEE